MFPPLAFKVALFILMPTKFPDVVPVVFALKTIASNPMVAFVFSITAPKLTIMLWSALRVKVVAADQVMSTSPLMVIIPLPVGRVGLISVLRRVRGVRYCLTLMTLPSLEQQQVVQLQTPKMRQTQVINCAMMILWHFWGAII